MADKSGRATGIFRIVYGIVKGLALVGGLPLTLLALMALVGLITPNGWVRLVASLVIAIGPPLFIVDRLLPSDDLSKAKGMPTDTLALIWAGFAVAYFGAAHGLTQGATVAEADRLARSGYTRLATTGYWLAAARPVAPTAQSKRGEGNKASTSTKAKAASKTRSAARSQAKEGAREASAKPQKSSDEKGTGKPKADAGVAAKPKGDASPPDSKASKKKTAPPAKRSTLTPQELFARFAPSVVTIRCERSSGTGFLIDDIGTIVTNHHVIAKQRTVEIKLKTGKWVGKLDVLAEDKKRDLALLRSKVPLGLSPLSLGDSDTIKVGERVIAIGNPLGLDHTLTDGVVSARRIYQQKKWVQTSAPVSPGNSGGPLFNMHGEVIGVVTAQIGGMWRRAQNLNLAVPINDLKKMIKDDYPNRRAIGADAPKSW